GDCTQTYVPSYDSKPSERSRPCIKVLRVAPGIGEAANPGSRQAANRTLEPPRVAAAADC
ncbi:MAG: hypothetical protein AAF722_12000, partial [Cyanobacteria bacterium P01_C01_bin.70]